MSGHLMVNLDRVLPAVAPVVRRGLKRKKADRRAQFEAMPRGRGRVVFLGDSITEWGVWEGWFPDLHTANRGISGDTVGEVLARLDSAIDNPRIVSLMIGTNDLHGLGRSRRPADIADQVQHLLVEIRTRAPMAPVLLNSVLPRSALFAERIRELNDRYEQVAGENGATFVDLGPAFADRHGALRRELTPDGIHLTAAGYAAWVAVLEPHLRQALAGNRPSLESRAG
jgi:lysophospholipase L1-like esterase